MMQVELAALHYIVKEKNLMCTQLVIIFKCYAFPPCLRKALGEKNCFIILSCLNHLKVFCFFINSPREAPNML